MKNLLFIVLSLICVQATAFSGKPSRDPVVADLKNQFSASKTPTVEDFINGPKYSCRAESAYANQVSSGKLIVQFSAWNGRVMLGTQEYYYSNNELMTRWVKEDFYNIPVSVFVRINTKGNLLLEWAADFPSWWIFQDLVYERSVVDSNLFAFQYAICTEY